MNLKSLFSLLVFVHFSTSIFAQYNQETVKKYRLFSVSSSTAIVLTGAYFYVENSWWADKQIPFHFDNGSDLRYALNVDKAGHLIGGLLASDFFSHSMQWAGVSADRAVWHGAFFGTGLQLAIEMKDAYAPYWGFSKWDLGAGSIGAFWPVAQKYINCLDAVNFKFSYYKRSNTYWQLDQQRGKELNKYSWQDDYPNQTYWMTFDVSHVVETCCWPEWLDIALGFGLDDTQFISGWDPETQSIDNLNVNAGQKMGGNNEWYLSLDYDLPKLFKRVQYPLLKKAINWLNYIHLPAPAIRIYPKLEFYPLFL